MQPLLYALISAVFAALVAIFGKIGLKDVDSTLATAIRSIVMASFLCIVALSLGKAALIHTIDSKALTYIILSGVAGALSWLFYFFAIKNGQVAGVAAIDRTSIVFVFILAVLFLGETYTRTKALGALLITIGAICMSL